MTRLFPTQLFSSLKVNNTFLNQEVNYVAFRINHIHELCIHVYDTLMNAVVL